MFNGWILTELRPSEESGDCAASRITLEQQNVKGISLLNKLLLINLVKLPKLLNHWRPQLFPYTVRAFNRFLNRISPL